MPHRVSARLLEPSDWRAAVEVVPLMSANAWREKRMSGATSQVLKFVSHSRYVQRIARRYGWLSAARYTNLRDVRSEREVGFVDIDWKNYNFNAHVAAVKARRPLMTVARDIETLHQLSETLRQAEILAKYARYVILVPKLPSLAGRLDRLIPREYILGFSVPTRYGATSLPVEAFEGRSVHLLGGRPDAQRRLADRMSVVSMDCNRFTLDARYGDYFDGETFRPHPRGGYGRCLSDSVKHIDHLWRSYRVSRPLEGSNGERH